MRILSDRFVLPSRSSTWELDIYGDTHLGVKAVAEDRLRADIKDTLDNERYWCHVGDVVDGIVPGDRRFSEQYKSMLTDWAWEAVRDNRLIQAQWDYFYDMFAPIKDRGLFVLSGDGAHNRTENIADCFRDTRARLGVDGGFPACFYVPKFNRGREDGTTKTIPMVFHHGYFAGRTKSNKIINLERALNQFHDVWIVIVGHGHEKCVVRVDSLALEGGDSGNYRICEHVRRGAMTGAYLRTYMEDLVGYGEVKGYPPTALGKITLVVQPFSGNPEQRITFKNM